LKSENPRAIKTPKQIYDYSKFVADRLKIKSLHRVPYYYDENQGIYVEAEQLLRFELTSPMYSMSVKDIVIRTIIDLTDQTEEQITLPKDVIACNNGLLNLKTRELTPFSRYYFIRNKIPIDYNPDAICPSISKFLNELLEQEHVLVLEKMLAYILKLNTNYTKAFFFEGSGANGKSVLCELIIAFLGQSNIAHNSLHDLSQNKFRLASLDGKLANIYADLGSNDIVDSSIFKILASGETVMVERKGQDAYTMNHNCKLLFSANSIPLFKNVDNAVLRRMVIIPFMRVFEGTRKKDKSELLNSMTTKQELSGLLNIVLNAYDKLRVDIFDKPLEQIRQHYLSGSDSLGKFVREKCILGEQCKIESSHLFREYHNYCKTNNLMPLNETNFGRRLSRLNIEKVRPQSNGDRYYGYHGVQLK
jgi:putative DNA primase/helicase